ncbi:MAG: extracellular solute-binding protein [Clostridia bacterium]|nr:extracellular solute-binding protein [Clostridia bacterium]
MKRTVKIICLLAAALLLMTGCSAPPRDEGSSAPAISLSALQYEIENIAVDFSSMWYFRQIEQQTGVHVDFNEVKDSEWSSSVGLAFAQGKMPDMILRGSLDVEEYGVKRHLLVPLDEYIEKGFLPNYATRMDQAGLREQLTASDGHIYQLGFLISQDVNTNGHFFINKTWLDRLKLPVPETVEQLTEVLRHFREDDPNGNGIQDEIPLEFTLDDNTTGIYNLFSFFGLPLNEDYVYADKAGRVHFAPEEDAFFDTLSWLHQLYQEKLLDIDFISQGGSIWAAKVNEGNTGMFSYWRLQNTALNPGVAGNYEIMLPVHAEGKAACLPRNMDIIEFGAALTKDNRNIEASLRWLDAQFETENMLVSQNGPVGDTLIRREDGRYEVSYVPPDNELYQAVPVICGQFFAPADYYASVYVPAAHRLEKAAYCDLYERSGVLEPISAKLLTTVAPKTTDQSAETTRLKAKLKSLVDAEIVSMVTQGVTEEGCAAFRESLKAGGSADYRQVYQQIYDRWKEK